MLLINGTHFICDLEKDHVRYLQYGTEDHQHQMKGKGTNKDGKTVSFTIKWD